MTSGESASLLAIETSALITPVVPESKATPKVHIEPGFSDSPEQVSDTKLN